MSRRHHRSPLLREKCVGAKVTESEYATIEALALASRQTVSSWARATLVSAGAQASIEHTVLAELLALRKILLNLHFALAKGEPLTRDLMAQLIADADAEKGQKATARLQGG